MRTWSLGGRDVPRPIAVGGVAGVVAIATSSTFAPDAHASLVVAHVVWNFAALVALGACWGAARSSNPPFKKGWILLTVAFSFSTASNVGSAFHDLVLGRDLAVAAIPDLLYLPVHGLLACAMAALVRPFLGGPALRRALVDFALVAVALAYLSATTILADPAYGLTRGIEQVAAWAFPILDIVVVAIALIGVSRAPRTVLRVGVPLAAGFVGLGIADSLWSFNAVTGEHVGETLSATLFAAGALLVALAAASRVAEPPADERLSPSWIRQTPYLGVIAAVLLFATREVREPFPEVVAVAVVLLLLLRQLLAVRENQALNCDLEARVVERTSSLSASEERFRTMADTISDFVVVVDARGTVVHRSPGLSGIDLSGLTGADLVKYVHPDDVEAAIGLRLAITEAGSSATARLRLVVPEGTVVEATFTNLTHERSIDGFMFVLRDVTDEAALEDRLRHQATHDDLTDLPNRSLLRTTLDAALHNPTPRPGVILLDLDAFKAVNDNLGHAVGDQLLVAVGALLRAAVSDDGEIARVSGDEFAVVVFDAADALQVARRVLAALALPVAVGERSLRCQASIGVAVVGDDADTLLRNADLAMYEAKQHGKARIEEFRPGMHHRLVRRLDIEDGLAMAIARSELHVAYQPVVDILTGEILGAEALLRWSRPGRERVDPSEFIPVAEETGLIGEIGSWVLHEACTAAAGWRARHTDGTRPTVAVNASVRQLVEHDLVGDVTSALLLSGLPAASLTIELTETSLMEHTETVLEQLRVLKDLGVRLSIDDFGTGYSSLGRLRFLPVDEVKIDRSFVSTSDSGELDAPVVEAVLALAASLGLEVVAEGIELPGQLADLGMRGCRKGQGFLLGRPMSSAAFEHRLSVEPRYGLHRRPKLSTWHSTSLCSPLTVALASEVLQPL